MKVLAHVRPEDRTSWGVRAFEGFYIGPALNHYRCYKIYNRKTNSVRICDQIKWLPRGYRMLCASRDALILAAANDLAKLLRSKQDTYLLPPEGSETRFELQALARTLGTAPTQNPNDRPSLSPKHERNCSTEQWYGELEAV